MPEISDWRSAAAYTYLKDLGTTEFAWEFLRRNSDYQHDYQSIRGEAGASAEIAEPVARRWGLRFRGRSGSAIGSRSDRMAARPRSRRRSRHSGSGDVRECEPDWLPDAGIQTPRRRR